MSDIFEAFEVMDELIERAPSTEPPPEKKFLPTVPGRENPAPFTLQKLAKDYTEKAFETILEIMNDKEQDGSTRLEAAKQVLDRGWGKATVKVQAETIQYTLQDVQDKLLEQRAEIDAKVEEARRIERERIAGYLAADAELVEDITSRSEGTLQDHS